MTNAVDLANQLTQARNELNNLRKRMHGLQAQHRKDITRLEELLLNGQTHTEDSTQRVPQKPRNTDKINSNLFVDWKPIGHITSWFHTKNGTPRQGSLSNLGRGKLKVDKNVFNNPQHAIDGLHEYSHVWIFFVFHQNKDVGRNHRKTKVAPPRLNGQRIGVFATRSPHRPNPLGLTLARLEKIQDDCVYLSGLDILDGTPVLDIKPYIPQYDDPYHIVSDPRTSVIQMETDPENYGHLEDESFSPLGLDNQILSDIRVIYGKSMEESGKRISEFNKESNKSTKTDSTFNDGNLNVLRNSREKNEALSNITYPNEAEKAPSNFSNKQRETQNSHVTFKQQDFPNNMEENNEQGVTTAAWLGAPPSSSLKVVFNPLAEPEMKLFSQNAENSHYRLEFLRDSFELKTAISIILAEDPRSSYRRQKCASLLYYFTVDTAHITAWFEEDVVEVLRVHPLHTRTAVPKMNADT